MKAKEKHYTYSHILKEFDQLTKDKKINVLYDAIDIMQQSNSRSRFACIAMVLGYENYEGGADTYTKMVE